MAHSAKIVELGVFHHDCFGCLVTEKFPGVSIEGISDIQLLHKAGKLVGSRFVGKITAGNEKELNCFLESLKNFKSITSLEILSKSNANAVALVCTKSDSSSYFEILNNGAVHIANPRMEQGFDVHRVLTANLRELKKVLGGLRELGEVKVKSIGPASLETNHGLLTQKQLAALESAVSFGYYSWPKKARLEFLAKQCNLSRRTYQDHLRKAESKLFPALFKEYLLAKQVV